MIKYCSTPMLIATMCLACTASAQTNYTVDWFTVDGGGGASTGGSYAVSGIIGQPDAGLQMSGGSFTLIGGFWAMPVAVQTPGAPMLTIRPGMLGFATISWVPSTPGFVLQYSATLSPFAWTNAPSGASNPTAVPATMPTRFYRLINNDQSSK